LRRFEEMFDFLPQCPYCYNPINPGTVCNCPEGRKVFSDEISKYYNAVECNFFLEQKHVYWLTDEIAVAIDEPLTPDELKVAREHPEEVMALCRARMVKFEPEVD
jgi:hypothetical protein